MAYDSVFKDRLCQNTIIKVTSKPINLLKIKELLIMIFPKFLCPYLIMEIKKLTIPHSSFLSFLFYYNYLKLNLSL
jgi:hypothetical protein